MRTGHFARPIRVLSVIHSAAFGGPHNQAVALATAVPEVELIVAMPDEPGDAASRLRDAGVHVVTLELRRPRASLRNQALGDLARHYPAQVTRLVDLIRRHRVDVVEAHGLMNLDAPVAAKLSGRALVWQLIDTRPPRALRYLLMPAVVSLSDVIMTTGLALASSYPGARLRPSRLKTFVPPVLTTPSEATGRPSVRENLGLSADDVLVAAIGNLNPQKGFGDLIEALAWPVASEDFPRRPALRIRGSLQAGHEAYAVELAKLAHSYDFGESAVGEFEPGLDVGSLLLAADIFALTSRPRSEGIPTVVLEAMAAGLPVVATDVGALREVLRDGRTGFLVQPGDVHGLRSRLASLVGDPRSRSAIGHAASRDALKEGSPQKFGSTMLDAYTAALRSSRRRSPWRARATAPR